MDGYHIYRVIAASLPGSDDVEHPSRTSCYPPLSDERTVEYVASCSLCGPIRFPFLVALVENIKKFPFSSVPSVLR